MLRNTHCYSNWGAAMRNPNENERLRAEFFRQYGKPLERVRGVRAARGGSIHQLYRDSDGKLSRMLLKWRRCRPETCLSAPKIRSLKPRGPLAQRQQAQQGFGGVRPKLAGERHKLHRRGGES